MRSGVPALGGMKAMDQELDRLFARLKAQGPDRRLDGLEPQVFERIAHQRRIAAGLTAQLQWRAAAIGLALSFGAAFGGIMAGQPSDMTEMAVFSVNSVFAPSTILERRS